MTYRVGSPDGRSIYEVLGDDPLQDRFIGIMDTPELASRVVIALNESEGRTLPRSVSESLERRGS